MGRKPELMASVTLARTQPLVVQPAISTVSTPAEVYQAARLVPKKRRGQSFTQHEFAGQRRQFGHDL